MILSESFSVLPQSEKINVGRTLSLSLWPISSSPLRSSLRSLTYDVLSNTNDLKMISVLAVFSLTPLKTRELPAIDDVKRFPTTEFKNAFLSDGFSQPINLSNNRGFAFFLSGTESDPLSRARSLSFEKVIDERMIDGNKYSRIEINDLFELFPILTQFSLRFPIKAPPLTSTTFCPIIKLVPFRERLNSQSNNKSIPFSILKQDSSKSDSSLSLDCSKSEKLDRWSKHLSPILGTTIYISGEKIAHNKQMLKDNKITHIINCASHLISACGDYLDAKKSASEDDDDILNDDFVVLRLPMSDGGDESIFSWIFKATSFIKDAINENNNNKILIHCIQGSSRSASIVIGYLILTRKYDYDKAYKIVREKRRIASPHPKFMAQLIQLSEIVGGRPQKTSLFFKQKEIRFYLTTKKYVSHIGQNEPEKVGDSLNLNSNNKNFKYSFVMKPRNKPSEGLDAKCFVTIDFRNVGDEGLYKMDQSHYKTRGVVTIESPEVIEDENEKKVQNDNDNEYEEEEEYDDSQKVTKKELNFVLNFADEIENCLRVTVNRTYRAYKSPNWDNQDATFSIKNHDKEAVYVLVDLLGAKLFVGKKVNKKSTNFDSIIESFCKAHKFDKSMFKIVFENENDEEFLADDNIEEEEEECLE